MAHQWKEDRKIGYDLHDDQQLRRLCRQRLQGHRREKLCDKLRISQADVAKNFEILTFAVLRREKDEQHFISGRLDAKA